MERSVCVLHSYLYVRTSFNTVAIYVRELLRFGTKFKCDITLWFVDVVVHCFFYCKFVIFVLLTDCPFYKVCFVQCTYLLYIVLVFCCSPFCSWLVCLLLGLESL